MEEEVEQNLQLEDDVIEDEELDYEKNQELIEQSFLNQLEAYE